MVNHPPARLEFRGESFGKTFDTLDEGSVYVNRIEGIAVMWTGVNMGLLSMILNAYGIVIFLRAIMSWFAPSPGNAFYRFLIDITEPVLAPLRRVLPEMQGIDLSPFAALLIIQLIRSLIA